MTQARQRPTWGGGENTGAVGSINLFARMHAGGGDLPAGEIFFEGVRGGDTVVVFKNASDAGVTVRRVCGLTDGKLAEVQFAPGAMAAWGAGAPEGEQPAVWTGPGGATFRLLAGGQRAVLTPGRRA